MQIKTHSYFISPGSGRYYKQTLKHVLKEETTVLLSTGLEIEYLPESPFLPRYPTTLDSFNLLCEDGYNLLTEDNYNIIL